MNLYEPWDIFMNLFFFRKIWSKESIFGVVHIDYLDILFAISWVKGPVSISFLMSCFCGIVDQRKWFNLFSSRRHHQIFSPSQISDTPWEGFEPAQNLSLDLAEWSCAAEITTTPRRQLQIHLSAVWMITVNKQRYWHPLIASTINVSF